MTRSHRRTAFATLVLLGGTLAVSAGPLAGAADRLPPAFCNGEPETGGPTSGDDVIVGTAGNDVIDGLGGDDLICGRAGSDVVRAGSGFDVVYGQGGHDRLNGGSQGDTLIGETGDDVLNGGTGGDSTVGGPGRDQSNGGPGIDNCFSEVFVACEGD